MLALFLWLGCGEKEPTNPLILDVDGDGYKSDVDCDDNNADVFPNAPEICDGVDNDCDALIDSDDDSVDADPWYADLDEDGFGSGEAILSCEALDGFVVNADDCNDQSAEVNPNAEEICDSIDNNCNGVADDLPPDFEDPFFAVYVDNDGDGFGDVDTLFYACDTSAGVVDIAYDCDDSDSMIYPDAEETCDGVDNDCDAIIDEQESGQGQCDECTDEVLASVTGSMTQSILSGDDVQASCSQTGASDIVFRWIAPATGSYTFQSGISGGALDGSETIAIWKECGSIELACDVSVAQPASTTIDAIEGDVYQIVLEGPEGNRSDLHITTTSELSCDDDNDDDQDGLIDCDDELDCWFAPTCGGSQCPNFSLVDPIDYVTPLNGDSITTQSLGDFTDSKEATCFAAGASDVTFSYTAASNGCAQVFVHSDSVDVQMAVYDSCGGSELECNDGSSVATTRFGTAYGAYIPLQMTIGEEYIIAVSGQNISSDDVTLSIDRNDEVDCSGASVE